MSKLWCFGDSFTKGGGLEDWSVFRKKYPEKKKIWPEIVGKELNMEVVNHGYSWCGTTLVLKNLFYFLPSINDNDIVILSTGNPRSILMPPMKEDSSLLRTVLVPNKDLPHNDSPFKNEDEKEIANMYAQKIIDPNLQQYDKFWYEYLQLVQNTLTRLGIRNYLWSWKLWTEFETITEYTNGEVNDLHWSWNGHEQMAEYMLKKIKND